MVEGRGSLEEPLERTDEYVGQAITGSESRREAQRKKSELLPNILEITRALNRARLELDEVFRLTSDWAQRLTGTGFVQVLLVEGNELEIRATTGQEPVGTRVKINDCVSGKAYLQREVVNVPDVSQEPLYKGYLGERMRSELAVPVTLDGEVVAVFNVESPRLNRFSRRHEERLAAYVAETVLPEIEAVLSGEREVTDRLLREGLERIGMRHGEILVVEGDELVIEATIGEDLGARVAVGESVTGLAVERGTVVNIPDVDKEPRYQRYLGAMKSELIAPLMMGEEVLGVLNVESPRPAAFSHRHEQLLRGLADQVVRPIDHARIYEDLAILLEMSGALNRARLELDEVFRLTVEWAQKLIGTSFVQVLLVEGDELEIRATTGQEPVGTRVRIDDCVSGKAYHQRDVVNVPDVSQEPLYKGYLGERMRSEMAVPVTVDGEVMAVFNVESPRPNRFSRRHEERLGAYVAETVLSEIEAVLDGEQEVTNRLLREGLARIGVSHGQFLVVEGDELVIEATTGEDLGARVGVGNSVTGLAVKRGTVVNIPDVDKEPRYQRYLGAMKSELIAPLMMGEEVLGVLNVESPRLAAFGHRHEQLLRGLADQVAIALRDIRRYQELREEREKRDAAETIAAVGDFAGGLVHQLNNIVGAARFWIKEIEMECPQELEDSDFMRERLQNISRNIDLALEIPQKVKDRFRLDEPTALELIDVNPLLSEELHNMRIPENVRVIEHWAEGIPRLRLSKMLGDIFRILVKNAVDAMPSGGTLTVGTNWTDDHRVEILVQDTGVGIPEEHHDQIFDLDYSTKEKGKGLGYGLWWVKKFALRFGGTVSVESEPGKGAKFVISLPMTEAASVQETPS